MKNFSMHNMIERNELEFFMVIHVVQNGETIDSIAQTYGVNANRLSFDNQVSMVGGLVEGQSLLVLVPEEVYTVMEGETLESIAQKYGTNVMTLARNNPVVLVDEVLNAGEQLIIRYQSEEKLGTMTVDGFAYPYIPTDVFREVLAYLSELSCFSYGFTTAGELIPIDDAALLAGAFQYGVKPVLVLTPFGELGNFSNELVSVLVNDETVQENLINNLTQTVQEKKYGGVNIDFEYVLAEDRDAYISFVRKIRSRMNEVGVTVTVCLAPKISDEQQGLLYQGVDYAALGEAADYVLVMTYEWGYTWGPAMAVSPINKVREVLDYAVSRIDPAKIRMGMSNYGYDWPLPYEKGVSKAETIGNVQALSIARENGAVIQYNETSQAPYFTYTRDGVEHEVWFEDARSINARLRLVPEYGFDGVGYWTVMKPFRVNWLLVNELFNIR